MQQLSHVLNQLLCMLLHALVCIHIHEITRELWLLGNAQHRQGEEDQPSHGLQEV